MMCTRQKRGMGMGEKCSETTVSGMGEKCSETVSGMDGRKV